MFDLNVCRGYSGFVVPDDVDDIAPDGIRIITNELDLIFQLFPHTFGILHFVGMAPKIEEIISILLCLFVQVVKSAVLIVTVRAKKHGMLIPRNAAAGVLDGSSVFESGGKQGLGQRFRIRSVGPGKSGTLLLKQILEIMPTIQCCPNKLFIRDFPRMFVFHAV